MKTLVLDIPNTVDFDDKEALTVIASRLYEKSKLTLEQAAQMTGISKELFMENLSSYGVAVFNYTPTDLDRDVDNAKNYNI